MFVLIFAIFALLLGGSVFLFVPACPRCGDLVRPRRHCVSRVRSPHPMSALGKLARASYKAHRYERAARNPGRYARNRAISKGLGAVGFWRMFGRLWR